MCELKYGKPGTESSLKIKKMSTYSKVDRSSGQPGQVLNREQEDQISSVSKHNAKPFVSFPGPSEST